MIKGPKKTVAVILPLHLYQTLREQAHKSCRSLPGYIRLILNRYVDYLEKQGDNPDEWLLID